MMMSPLQWSWLILLSQAFRNVEPCADIVFVLDGSASVKEQFQQMINMASAVATQFDIDNKGHRIAILEYSGKAILPKWLRYNFDRIQTNDDIEKVIKKLPHIRGATDTGRALGVVFQEYLPQRRSTSPFVVFTITDGYYRDSEEVLQNVASLTAQPNVQLFVATASKPYNMRGLLLLANNDSSHIAAGADALSTSRNLLKSFISCLNLKTYPLPKKVTALPSTTASDTIAATRSSSATAARPVVNVQRNLRVEAKFSRNSGRRNGTAADFVSRTPRSIRTFTTTTVSTTIPATTATREAKKKLDVKPECLFDVVFLMDFSDGASDKREKYIELVSTLINSLNIGQTPAQVSAIRYSGPKRSDTLFHLRKHSSAEEAIKELNQAPSSGGTTRTGEAIQYAIGEFDEKYGARKDAPKMLIIFTDGYSQDDPTDAAQDARRLHIEVKAVAVEDEDVPPDTEQLIAITGGDPTALYFTKDFNRLQSLFDGYSRRCKL